MSNLYTEDNKIPRKKDHSNEEINFFPGTDNCMFLKHQSSQVPYRYFYNPNQSTSDFFHMKKIICVHLKCIQKSKGVIRPKIQNKINLKKSPELELS